MLLLLNVFSHGLRRKARMARMNEALRSELMQMDEHDQAVRAGLAADGSLFDGYHPRMGAVHDANAARLRTIIATRGWRTERLVGVDGAKAAHRIAQHSINHPDFMRECRRLLDEASARGEVPRWQFNGIYSYFGSTPIDI